LAKQLGRDDDPLVRRAAAEALLALHTTAAREALVQSVRHPRGAVRAEAATVLGRWAEPSLAEVLHPVLADKETNVARAAAEALGRLGNPVSQQPLLDALVKAPPLVQERIAWSLGELRAASAVAALEPLLQTMDEDTKASVAEALGKIGDRQPIPALRKVLVEMKAHGPVVRQRAIEALRRLADRDSTKRVMQIVTERVVPPPPMGIEWSYDAEDTRAEGVRYLQFIGEASLASQMLKKMEDLPSYPLRQVMAGMASALTGQPHMAAWTVDTRHYRMESLGGESFPRSLAPPGIVPVP
jgi:HEAT repeat protein